MGDDQDDDNGEDGWGSQEEFTSGATCLTELKSDRARMYANLAMGHIKVNDGSESLILEVVLVVAVFGKRRNG